MSSTIWNLNWEQSELVVFTECKYLKIKNLMYSESLTLLSNEIWDKIRLEV